MRITQVNGFGIDEAWFNALHEILRYGKDYVIDHGSFEGHKRKELDCVVVHVKSPGVRPFTPFVPEGVPAPTDEDYIRKYADEYILSGEVKPNEEYTYGYFIMPQLEAIIEKMLKYGPRTNQTYISVGNEHSIDLANPPCLRGVDLKVYQEAEDGPLLLSFITYWRSWDCWAGLPSNLGGIQLLKEYAIERLSPLGVRDGELIAMSKGLHLYDYSWEHAKKVTGYYHS